jgi:hypothetical protein
MPRGSEDEEALLELAVHMEAKKTASDQLAFLAERVTWRSAWPTLWRIAARGFFSPALMAQQLAHLASDVTNAKPDELVRVLTHVPRELPEATTGLALLGNYPVTLDALVMHAAHRAPLELAAVEKELPPNVRRALPLVRRRLGLEQPAHAPELFEDLVKTQVRSTARGDVWGLSDGKLVREPLERFEQMAALAALLAPGQELGSAIVAAVPAGELPPHQVWRLEPFYVSAPAERFFGFFERSYYESESMLPVLALRKDPPELLFAFLRSQQAKEGTINDWLANAIARRLHELGKPVPVELDAEVTFQSAPRVPDERVWTVYMEGLRAFPRERILARVDSLWNDADVKVREDSVIGLRAYPDDARIERATRDPEVCRLLGQVGTPAISALRAALNAAPAESDHAFMLRHALGAAFLAAPVVDPEFDELVPISHHLVLVAPRLPPERFDRLVEAHLDEHIERVVSVLHLVGDDVLDQALGKLVARDPLPDLRHAFAALGARATAPLMKHLANAPPARIREVVDQSRLPDDVAAQLLGDQRHVPLPIVSGDITDGPRFLALVVPHLDADPTPAWLRLTGTRIALGDSDEVTTRYVLDRSVPAGRYRVTAYYKELSPGLPTCGLEAIMIRFSETDTLPTTWVEAKTEDGESLLDDAYSFWIADEKRIVASAKVMQSAIAKAEAETYVEGIALADLPGDGDDESGAFAVYVGECCREERVYWGLDADGAPAALIAAFEYVVGVDDG